MGVRENYIAGLSGTVTAVLTGLATPPLVALAFGAFVSFVVARRYNAQLYYDSIGSILTFALGLVLSASPYLNGAFSPSFAFLCLLFGGLGGAVVLVKRGIKLFVVKTVDGVTEGDAESASNLSRFVTSVLGTLVLAWSLVKIKERLVRTGATAVTLPVSFVLNLVGVTVNFPVYVEALLVNTSSLLFVGAMVIAFHTLTSWYAMLALRHDPYVRALGKRSKEVVAGTDGEGDGSVNVESQEYCVACGEDILSAAILCPECGVRQSPDLYERRDEVHCLRCGAGMDSNAEVCPACGIRQELREADASGAAGDDVVGASLMNQVLGVHAEERS